MTEPTRVEIVAQRTGLPMDRAEKLVARFAGFADLEQGLADWCAERAVDPELTSNGHSFSQLVEYYRFSELRALDLLAQMRVDPQAENFLIRRDHGIVNAPRNRRP